MGTLDLTVVVMGSAEKTRVYWQRWWILAIFSLLTMWSCSIWNTFSPFAATAKKTYGWTDSTLTQMTLWAVLCFPVFFLPSAYLLSRSLRYSVLAAALVTFLGPTLRCLPLWFPSLSGFTLLCHIGAFINGVGGPINMAAPIQISAAWFPPHERTRATSIGQMFNALGVGVSFLLGTMVESVDNGDLKKVESDIRLLVYLYAGVAIVI